MPLRSLRPNPSDRDLHRRSTLDPANIFRRGDRNANKSSERLSSERIAVSEDGGRPTSTDVSRLSVSANTDGAPPSPPIQDHTPSTRRFSLMRFRHASDSQLSTKAKEQAPPVPAMPAGTPAIITTAPTIVENEDQLPKRRGRFPQFSLRRRSFDPSSFEAPDFRISTDSKTSSDMRRGTFGPKFMKSQTTLFEEPGRLSTTQGPDGVADPSREPKLSLSVPRASDSSRSDASSAGHVSFENTPKPRMTPRTNSHRFGFRRRNKQRDSLFPLPMKISPPEFPNTAPATPRASTSAISAGSVHHSPTGDSPPGTVRRLDGQDDVQNGTMTPDMPSPSKVAMAAASLNFSAPGSIAPASLMRNDSTKSVRSAHSSPTGKLRLGLRGRSSTMGSLGGRSDDVPPTPPYATSGRTSTSTVGRSSLSNLFGLNRFRQNSEPHSPRHGSPAHGFGGTSGVSSHQNSLNISREALAIPKREPGDTPGRYLQRMEDVMDRGVIPSVLTKTDDSFMLSVLRSFMRKFAFFGDPIDMAIRKLLMHVQLPKETQQIDRVLQGFSDRYHECNPGIFVSTDIAYFISFSILILHTDFFNKNNKRKMQREDYIRNSTSDGVSETVLACIYDNTVYTPFIHFDDEVDVNGGPSRRTKKASVFKAPMSDPTRKATREPMDPYSLILEGKLDALRPTIKDVMNIDDPYNYLGTASSLDTRTLYSSFSKYGVIQIVSSRSRPEAFMSQASQDNPLETSVGIVEMPVTKIGILWRKDSKRKAARSPWQEWGAVLTRSGVHLFRNHGWAKGLMHQHDQHQKHGFSGPVVFQPPLQDFKSDQLIPLDGAVALVDSSYKKHKHAFVMCTKNGGEEIFLADSEKDLNDWLGLLNYSAAFETLGVRPRGLIGGLYDGQRNRGIHRLESSHSTKSVASPTGDVTISSGRIDNQLAQQVVAARRELMQRRVEESEENIAQSIKELENRLRDARHLQILAPIQPKTREVVVHAAGVLAARLKWARIAIWRMKCHRDIIAQELEEEKATAAERQALIDRITGGAPPSQTPQPSQLSPAAQSNRTLRIGNLARLSSKSSSKDAAQTSPHSPSTSARPGTKSSRDTELGEDIFRTPPETSHQSSPASPPGQFPPLTISPQLSHRRESMASSSTRSPYLSPRDHKPSMSTLGDKTISSDAVSDAGSLYGTPPRPSDVDGHKEPPKTPEGPALDRLRADHMSESDIDPLPSALTGSPQARNKHRRSLHRTLRDSHGSSHRRSHKGKDSASTIVSEDNPENEVLHRGKGSFTVHGKKASVITFGAEWQNMPAEERLKVRRQAQEALDGGSSIEEHDGGDDRAISVASGSTATGPSAPINGAEDETTPRPSTQATRNQRHISLQTIVPITEKSAVDEEKDCKTETSLAHQDTRSSKHAADDQKDMDTDTMKLDTPAPQPVEA